MQLNHTHCCGLLELEDVSTFDGHPLAGVRILQEIVKYCGMRASRPQTPMFIVIGVDDGFGRPTDGYYAGNDFLNFLIEHDLAEIQETSPYVNPNSGNALQVFLIHPHCGNILRLFLRMQNLVAAGELSVVDDLMVQHLPHKQQIEARMSLHTPSHDKEKIKKALPVYSEWTLPNAWTEYSSEKGFVFCPTIESELQSHKKRASHIANRLKKRGLYERYMSFK